MDPVNGLAYLSYYSGGFRVVGSGYAGSFVPKPKTTATG
jgi:hypothetical protein